MKYAEYNKHVAEDNEYTGSASVLMSQTQS